MREILFRGKRKNGSEWFYGSYMGHYYSSRYGKVSAIFANDDSLCQTYRIPVDPETVGQFTGKTVKNGKVFDGDICKSIDGIFLVCWDEEKAAFVMRFLEYPFETLYLEEMWDDAEIIGTIHDNPELLEGGAADG